MMMTGIPSINDGKRLYFWMQKQKIAKNSCFAPRHKATLPRQARPRASAPLHGDRPEAPRPQLHERLRQDVGAAGAAVRRASGRRGYRDRRVLRSQDDCVRQLRDRLLLQPPVRRMHVSAQQLPAALFLCRVLLAGNRPGDWLVKPEGRQPHLQDRREQRNSRLLLRRPRLAVLRLFKGVGILGMNDVDAQPNISDELLQVEARCFPPQVHA